VLSIVSLLHDAKQHCEKYGSTAVDAGTFERSTIFFLTRVLNNMSAACEYSATQAVAYALGLPANFCLHKRCYIFSDRAIEYVLEYKQRLLNPDFEDQDSDNSSFSSGVYSSNSEAESSSADSEQCRSEPPCPKQITNLPSLSEDEEFGPDGTDDTLELSDSDSDAGLDTHAKIDSLLSRANVRHGSLPVTRNADGKLCLVPQAEDYHHRNEKFLKYSLYEFICCTYRRLISRKTKDDTTSDSSASDSDSDVQPQASNTPRKKAGRQPTELFLFQESHQLKDSHATALLKQYSVGQFLRKVPPYPGPRSEPLTESWKTRARTFAQFALVVFRPWQGPDGLPGPLTWREFCDFMHELKQTPTILNRTRAAFVLNVAHNLKFSSMVSKILKRFRGSAATRWLEMHPSTRPKNGCGETKVI
jgi:hypothetical protein